LKINTQNGKEKKKAPLQTPITQLKVKRLKAWGGENSLKEKKSQQPTTQKNDTIARDTGGATAKNGGHRIGPTLEMAGA